MVGEAERATEVAAMGKEAAGAEAEAPLKNLDTAALLKTLSEQGGLLRFAISNPVNGYCAIRWRALVAYHAAVGDDAYAAAGLPKGVAGQVAGELTRKQQQQLTKEKKKPLPARLVIVKAAREMLSSTTACQDFALVLALAAAKCDPGAIVMALGSNSTPHYLIDAVGAAAVQRLIEQREVTVESLEKMRKETRTTPEQIRSKVLMLLEGGVVEANTGELLVDFRALSPAVSAATIALRDALAAWSKGDVKERKTLRAGKGRPSVLAAFQSWCALAW